MADVNNTPVPGWIGGFAQSNPAFAYPDPNLSSLPVLDNMANIDKLDRQQKIIWPEFSWQTIPGEPGSRCYQQFATDISRVGYTAEGRVYSIICPQQGAASPALGAMNVEVTVTGQRGWVDEATRSMAADMTVEGKIWFSPGKDDFVLYELLRRVLDGLNLTFPDAKANAIHVKTCEPGNPDQPIFKLLHGICSDFPNPSFADHTREAWDVSRIEVQIEQPFLTGYSLVDDFNALVMTVFNLQSGNMLQRDNVLAWNIWFTAPELVDKKEWYSHAEVWRRSIDANHTAPEGGGTSPRFYDGSPFKPGLETHLLELKAVAAFLESHGKAIEALGGDIWHELEVALKHEFGKFDQGIGAIWNHVRDAIGRTFG